MYIYLYVHKKHSNVSFSVFGLARVITVKHFPTIQTKYDCEFIPIKTKLINNYYDIRYYF